MGLFHDICPACGSKVPKRARFCSICGHDAPEGWIKCPSCGKWVGNDSEYCPHCNHPLHPSERIDLAGGVWDREPECYAQRFELGDIRFINEHGILVQEGTSAIVLDGGDQVKVLGAGRHTPTGTLRTINWLGNPPPRSVVMVDSGDVVFRVEFKADEEKGPSLRSAEELEVGAEAEITVRFMPSKAEAFMQNFMKDLRKVTAKDVCAWLYQEALSAVRDICQQSTIEDLVKDPDRRERFEVAISQALKVPLTRCGFELVRVGAVEFFGEAYEEMREKYGDLEKRRRLVEFEKSQLALVAEIDANDKADKLALGERSAEYEKAKAKRVRDTEDYLAQLAQEKELGDIERTDELQIAALVAKGRVSAEEATQRLARLTEQHAFAMKELANKLELDLTVRNYDREQLIQDADNKAKLAAIGRDEELKAAQLNTALLGEKLKQSEIEVEIERREVELALYTRREKNKIDNEDAKAKADIEVGKISGRAQTVKGLSTTEMAFAIGGDEAAANVLAADRQQKEVDKLRIMSGMNEGQILAVNAGGDNVSAVAANADAIARIAEAKENASQQRLDERRQVDAETNARLDLAQQRMYDIAMESVKHQSTTIVPPSPPVTNIQH